MRLDDDYVARALKSDAAKASTEYSSIGLSAYMPRRPTGSAPKPNTRFLRNIIRETDSHNTALLAKEKREAREKERHRERNARKRDHGRLSPPTTDELDRPRKRRRSTEREARGRDRPDREPYSARDEHRRKYRAPRDADGRLSRSRSPSPRRHRNGVREQREPNGNRNETERGFRIRGRGSKSSNSPTRAEVDRREALRSRHYSSGSRSPDSSERHSHPVKSQTKYAPSASQEDKRRRSKSHDSDSDPLERFLGPEPPAPEPQVRSRGRGALAGNRAAMDEHFNSIYDPKVDVQPDPETEDDWDQALEAMRDRQKWTQQGSERLKAAGFSDAEVKKWAKGGEKDESDVQWTKKGEHREWDRGKVMGEDGVELEPAWGRLKDT